MFYIGNVMVRTAKSAPYLGNLGSKFMPRPSVAPDLHLVILLQLFVMQPLSLLRHMSLFHLPALPAPPPPRPGPRAVSAPLLLAPPPRRPPHLALPPPPGPAGAPPGGRRFRRGPAPSTRRAGGRPGSAGWRGCLVSFCWSLDAGSRSPI